MVSLLEFGVRSFFLALSFYGYLQLLRKRIRIELAVSLLLSAIGGAMFLAGMVNMLQEMTLFIFGAGLYLTYRSVRKKESPFELLTPGICFFLGGCAVLLYLIYGRKFDVCDDFTHWATAAKVLAQYDRFPNATNTDVSFTSYPLGSASFIYYITKILGISSEWIQCYAQNVLILSMVLSLFAFASGIYGFIIAAVVAACMMVTNSPLITLCVDTLLTVTAISAFAFCLYYRETLKEKIWYLLPYTVFLLSVKNSGILFVIFLYVYIACRVMKSPTDMKKLLLHALLTFSVLFFWQKHVNLVYDEGMMGRHSLSISYCASVFSGKSMEEILFTIRCVLESTFSLSNRMVCLLTVGFPGLLLLCAALKKESATVKRVYLFTAVAYCVYQVGLLGMYLFNMPSFGVNSAAEPLPSYIRYHDMMVDFAVGLFCICVLLTMAELKNNGNSHILRLMTGVVAGIVMLYASNPYLTYYIRYEYPGEARQKWDALIEEYDIQKDRRYFILVSDEEYESGYAWLIGQYLLEPRDIAVCAPASMEIWGENNCLKLYDYYILFDQTPETVRYFEDTFQTSESVVNMSKY